MTVAGIVSESGPGMKGKHWNCGGFIGIRKIALPCSPGSTETNIRIKIFRYLHQLKGGLSSHNHKHSHSFNEIIHSREWIVVVVVVAVPKILCFSPWRVCDRAWCAGGWQDNYTEQIPLHTTTFLLKSPLNLNWKRDCHVMERFSMENSANELPRITWQGAPSKCYK